jgi:hypothetical protein
MIVAVTPSIFIVGLYTALEQPWLFGTSKSRYEFQSNPDELVVFDEFFFAQGITILYTLLYVYFAISHCKHSDSSKDRDFQGWAFNLAIFCNAIVMCLSFSGIVLNAARAIIFESNYGQHVGLTFGITNPFLVGVSTDLFCPNAVDMINEDPNATVTFADGGWTIKGGHRIGSKSAWNLLGGFMEFHVDLSEVMPGVNANFYTMSPHFTPLGEPVYCIGRTELVNCMEMDIFESNGQCAIGAAIHTYASGNDVCGSDGCVSTMMLDPSIQINKVHIKAMFSHEGNMTVAVNGKLMGTLMGTDWQTGKPRYPSAASNRRVVENMKTLGAVIESSLWESAWVEQNACPKPSGDGWVSLARSNLTISNVKVMGSVVQGPTPTRCAQVTLFPILYVLFPIAITIIASVTATFEKGIHNLQREWAGVWLMTTRFVPYYLFLPTMVAVSTVVQRITRCVQFLPWYPFRFAAFP